MTATTASDPVVLDSSGWLEYLTDGPKADSVAPYLESNLLIVPSVVIYEVRKILSLENTKTLADIFYSLALRKMIVSFDEVLAVKSAELSARHKLAMADAIIYATAVHLRAQLITFDNHFADLSGVTLL
ncbi:MAG: type II toxin-antitoxin system VapC family toxin [Candidatus Acidiferrum sp.]